MAGKRTQSQRRTDFERLAAMIRQGKSQQEMAEVLGISQMQVSKDIAELRPFWIEAARNILEGTAVEAAVKVREVVVERYSDPAIAAVRLRGAEAVLDRVGLPKTTKSENKHDFGKLSDEDLIRAAKELFGRDFSAGVEASES